MLKFYSKTLACTKYVLYLCTVIRKTYAARSVPTKYNYQSIIINL